MGTRSITQLRLQNRDLNFVSYQADQLIGLS
jgi:hypothetical protein